jgi:hypothetical protein
VYYPILKATEIASLDRDRIWNAQPMNKTAESLLLILRYSKSATLVAVIATELG